MIEINAVTKEETAYAKKMTVTYQGQEYEILLYWNNWDGYEIDFIGTDEPDWAINWEEGNDESLASTLDGLTDEVIEESYL